MRGLSEKTIQFIKSSNDNVAVTIRDIIKDIKEDNKKALFLGIRDNFISIYCMGARAVVIYFNIDGTIRACETHKKYIKGFGKDYIVDKTYKNDYRYIRRDKINKKFFDELIDKVEYYTANEKASESIEKQYQQRIILSNNSSNTNSPWLCYDMEYRMEENGYGRYDILAISTMLNTEKKYSIGLIELKVDSKSLGSGKKEIKELLDEGMIREEGYSEYKVITKLNMKNVYSKGSLGSRVLGHFSDYIRYINDNEYMEKHNTSRFSVTKQEAVNILKNYDELTLCDGKFKEMVKDLNIDKISDVPKFIFLNYARDKKVKSVKTSFRNNVLGSNNFAIEKVWDEKVIDLYRNDDSEIQFKCIFKEGFPEDEANRAIFSDVEIYEAKNIFDEEAYK